MDSLLLPLLLLIANVMGGGMIIPQVIRLHRQRVVGGLSGVWIGGSIVMNGWWLAYAVQAGRWGIAPVVAVGVVMYSVIGWQLFSLVGSEVLEKLAIGLAVALFPLPILLMGGWGAAELAIGLSYGAQFAPAVHAAIRSTDVGGISPATWAMAWVEASIWLIYGLSIGDAALIAGGGGGTLMATVILLRLGTVARTAGHSISRPRTFVAVQSR